MLVSENGEENENYAVHDNDLLNIKEATAYFWFVVLIPYVIKFHTEAHSKALNSD